MEQRNSGVGTDPSPDPDCVRSRADVLFDPIGFAAALMSPRKSCVAGKMG